MNLIKFIMLIGLPASGKTEYAKNLQMKMGIDNTEHLSSDCIREELFGYECQEHNDKVFEEMNKRAINSIKDGLNVIYDATNISEKKRKNIIERMKKMGIKVEAHLLCTSISEIMIRNIYRQERQIPIEKINKMLSEIKCPMYYEGFDSIYLVQGERNFSLFDDKYFMNNLSMDQENPYHTEKLEQHLERTEDNVAAYNGKFEDELKTAAWFHDIGKVYTKKYNEKKDYYSYYGHENVSTYLYLCEASGLSGEEVSRLKEEEYRTAALIQNHNEFFVREDMTPIKERLGDLYSALETLHKADLDASTPIKKKEEIKTKKNEQKKLGKLELQKKLEKLELIFENCDIYTLDPSMIEKLSIKGISDGIDINCYQYTHGETQETKTCSSLVLSINEKGSNSSNSYLNTIFKERKQCLGDRIFENDITSIKLYFANGETCQIYIPWNGDNDFSNAYQKTTKEVGLTHNFEDEEMIRVIIDENEVDKCDEGECECYCGDV